MRSHAERAYPNECCGLMLGTVAHGSNLIHQTWAAENTWDATIAETLADQPHLTQTRRYWIAPQTFLHVMKTARQQGLDILGIYHSHPDHPAVPSECDRRLAWPHYSYLIFSVEQGQATTCHSWHLDQNHQFVAEMLLIQPQIPLGSASG